MKHRFTALCTLLSLATGIAGTSAQKLKGSDTLLPLVQKTSESYFHSHPSTEITVTGGGSGVGISALREGTTDIAMASRRMKFDERMKLQAAGHPPVEVTVAFDALAVVVNPANPVSKLTREQLEAIFRGKITNWKEVGGPDMRIVVYSRETSSGTYEFFKESVLRHRNYMASILSMPATGAVIQSVSQTPGAIGYVGLAYLGKKNIKPVSISYDGGKTMSRRTSKTRKTVPIRSYDPFISITTRPMKSGSNPTSTTCSRTRGSGWSPKPVLSPSNNANTR